MNLEQGWNLTLSHLLTFLRLGLRVVEPKEDAARFLAGARRALLANRPDRAQRLLSLGEIMARDSKVEYHLDAGRLWLEFNYHFEAHRCFLEAEDGDLENDEVQTVLRDLVCNLAATFTQRDLSPLGGFWSCLAARRTSKPPELDLEQAWDQLPTLPIAKRALRAVEILGIAAYLERSVGDLGQARRSLDEAPKSSNALGRFRNSVRELRQWGALDPVTSAWLSTLDAVLRPH